jgi:hypothetical protein
MSVVLAMREVPAPDVAIHEYPVHAIPFNRPYVGFVSVPLVGIFHSDAPVISVVYAIWSPLTFPETSPTTTQIGVPAPALYAIALLRDITGGMPPLVPEIVAGTHPVPISSPVSARHEILLAGDPEPPPPPPQQIHADSLYPIDVIRIPGNTDDTIARHPVAPVRSLV